MILQKERKALEKSKSRGSQSPPPPYSVQISSARAERLANIQKDLESLQGDKEEDDWIVSDARLQAREAYLAFELSEESFMKKGPLYKEYRRLEMDGQRLAYALERKELKIKRIQLDLKKLETAGPEEELLECEKNAIVRRR